MAKINTQLKLAEHLVKDASYLKGMIDNA